MGTHPKTFLYPTLDKAKMHLTENYNLNVCLDFILEKHPPPSQDPDWKSKKKVRVVKDSAEVELFKSHDHQPYPALSDHCGLTVDLEILP